MKARVKQRGPAVLQFERGRECVVKHWVVVAKNGPPSCVSSERGDGDGWATLELAIRVSKGIEMLELTIRASEGIVMGGQRSNSRFE